jgi:hypothetical protein
MQWKSIEAINFSDFVFEKHDTIIDSVKYNCRVVCKSNKAKIYGTVDKKNRKNNHWLVFDNRGYFFVQGDFKNDKKTGWWYYEGCCSSYYKNGKMKITTCAKYIP